MSKQTILAVDDSPTILKILEVILKQAGYEVVIAHDGLEGIHLAKQIKPDLIVLDFIMPKMNGFQVCKAMRKDEDLKATPIILMSAKGDKVGDKFIDILGAIDYLTKPFSPESILSLIPNVLRRAESLKLPAHTPDITAKEVLPIEGSQKPVAPEEEILKFIRDKVQTNFNSVLDSVLKAKNPGEVAEIVSDVLLESLDGEVLDLMKSKLEKMIPAANSENISMKGQIDQVPLPEVFQFAKFQNHTGTLKITRDEKNAYVFMRGGTVSFATFANPEEPDFSEKIFQNSGLDEYSIKKASRLAETRNTTIINTIVQEKIQDRSNLYNFFDNSTKSVIYEILTWKEGSFSFQLAKDHISEVKDIDLGLMIDQLVIDGLRIVDELRVIQKNVNSEDQIFALTSTGMEQMRTLDTFGSKIASYMDGLRNLRSIKSQMNISTYDLYKSVYELLSKGYLREVIKMPKTIN
jgi:DNA-binding response OmpR family regulator